MSYLKKHFIFSFLIIMLIILIVLAGCAPSYSGMMNSRDTSMMQNDPSGMMNSENSVITSMNQNIATEKMERSLKNAIINKQQNSITYKGKLIQIVVLGGPKIADGKFVIGGLINPTLRIPKDAQVHLTMINEDEGMPHGIEITSYSPPYANVPMMQGKIYSNSFIPPIPEAMDEQYKESSTTFIASEIGQFHYICQVPGHAAKGMFGTIVIF